MTRDADCRLVLRLLSMFPLASLILPVAFAWGLATDPAWAQEHAPAQPAARPTEKPRAAPPKPTAAPGKPRVTTSAGRTPRPAAARQPAAPAVTPEAARDEHVHSSPLHNQPPAPAIRSAVQAVLARRSPASATQPPVRPQGPAGPRYVVAWPSRSVRLSWPAIPERTVLSWPLDSSAPIDVRHGLDSAPSAVSTGRPR